VLINFIKMQAQGNDFVMLNLLGNKELPLDPPGLAKAICDRRLGVGADGLVLLRDDEIAAARMIIYNSDGSRAAMCGSALRCSAWLLAGQGKKNQLLISTDSGPKSVEVEYTDKMVHANLGAPRLMEAKLELEGIEGSLVDVGNLHFISWWDALDDDPHLQYGYSLEHSPAYEQGLNAMFARVISPQEIDLKIWENACGPTLACGTGATATVRAGLQKGLLSGEVKVNMPGGTVSVKEDSAGDFILSGYVEDVFNGAYRWKI